MEKSFFKGFEMISLDQQSSEYYILTCYEFMIYYFLKPF